MFLLTIIILIVFILYLIQNNISIVSLLEKTVKEQFLVAVKDRQKVGTVDTENGTQPKSTWKAGNRNYESCYSTETRNGNTTGRKNTFFCNQGIDGGEVIPAEGLYSLDFSNYNIHNGKVLRGKPLSGSFSDNKGKGYSLNSEGVVNGEWALTLAQSKSFCDFLKDKCEGFIMTIPAKGSDQNSKTIFIAKIEEGWEDPDTYTKKLNLDITSTNIISYVKKDVNYIEKAVSQDKINTISNKYINLPTCNWKSANRCIFRDYKYDQSNNTCKSNDGLSYNVDTLKEYNEQGLSNWLKTLYNRDIGVNKLASEAVNVNEYIERCKDVDGYEFLSGVDAPNPYKPTKQGDVKGRYIRISINNRDINQNWLQLAEVQVISNNRNIAMSKPTSSSGNYPGSSNSKANDGNNDGNWNSSSVYHSGMDGSWNNDGGPQFWEVDLGDASQTIDRIIISNRTDCCGGRLSNWLLTIYDNSKNAIWANVYRDPPNPKVSIDILQANNKLTTIKLDDYKQSKFNSKFYRVSPTEYKSKLGYRTDCNEECHKNLCEGEKKKWLSNYQCRDYRPGEWEAEQAEKRRIEEERKRRESCNVLIPNFDKDSDTATTSEGTYIIWVMRAYAYPCYNISTNGYINGGRFGSIFDYNDTTGVDFESYGNSDTYAMPYRIIVFLPPGIKKTFYGKLKMNLVAPWQNCLPKTMTVNTMDITSSEYNNFTYLQNLFNSRDIGHKYNHRHNLGQIGDQNQVNQKKINASWFVNFNVPFNVIVFEITSHWGSEGRSGSNSVWITNINFEEPTNYNSIDGEWFAPLFGKMKVCGTNNANFGISFYGHNIHNITTSDRKTWQASWLSPSLLYNGVNKLVPTSDPWNGAYTLDQITFVRQ
jgi:hypothetical protein